MIYGEIILSQQRKIVIQDSKIKNNIDIRTYLKTQNYEGYTKKGIVIQKEKLKELIEVLQKIQ